MIFRHTFVPADPRRSDDSSAFSLFSSSLKVVVPAAEQQQQQQQQRREDKEVEIRFAGWSYFEIVDYGVGMSEVRKRDMM